MLGRIASGVALASMAALVLVSCTPDGPTDTTPPPSPDTTTEQPLSDQQLEEPALSTAQRFVGLVDAGFADGELPVEDLLAVATESAVAEVQAELDAFREAQLSIEGQSTLDSPSLGSREESGPTSGNALLLACLDTSAVTTTDASGEVIAGDETRQPRVFAFDYEVDQILVTNVGPPAASTELSGCGD